MEVIVGSIPLREIIQPLDMVLLSRGISFDSAWYVCKCRLIARTRTDEIINAKHLCDGKLSDSGRMPDRLIGLLIITTGAWCRSFPVYDSSDNALLNFFAILYREIELIISEMFAKNF